MWPKSRVYTTLILAVHSFRILVVGKVRLCTNTQLRQLGPGQTDAAFLNHRAALGNPRSSMLPSGWTKIWACPCVFGPIFSSYSHLFNLSVSVLKTRPRTRSGAGRSLRYRRYQNRPTSPLNFVQMITVILLSTSALNVNLAMLRVCGLSWISSQNVLIRTVRPQNDCMPSGREALLKLS